MSFCTSCGKQIEDNSLFCEHCGARQEQSAPVASASPAPPPPVSEPSAPTQSAPEQSGYGAGTAYGQAPAPAAPRKPIPKGVKIAVLVVVILAVLAALFVFIMGKINDPQKTIAAFADSILTQDYEQFSKVTCPAGELELTEESVAPFFALYSDRTSALEEFQDSLSTDLKQLQQGRASTGNGLVRLVAQDRIFFKTYQVELSGTTISLSAPLNDVEVTVGGKTVELPRAEETAQVLLLPGRYDIEAQCTNDILGETFTTRMTDCELTQSSNYWYISMDYTTVWLEDIGREVSSLTVNGKDYGPVEFDTWGEMTLSPLPAEVEIQVTYQVDGVTLTDSHTCSGGYTWEYFYPEPVLSRETQQEMLDQTGALLRQLLDAYDEGDMSSLDELSSCPVVSFYADELESAQDLERAYREVFHYTLREMQGDLDWQQESSDGSLRYSTLVFLGLDYTYEIYLDGELQVPLEEDLAVEEGHTFDNMMRVYIQREDGQWKVTDLQWANYYSVSDLEDPYSM